MTYLNRKIDTQKCIRQENKHIWDLNFEKIQFVALASSNVAGAIFETQQNPALHEW